MSRRAGNEQSKAGARSSCLCAATLDAVIDTNLTGAMHVARFVVPRMMGRGSDKIINISSGVIESGHAMLSHCVASKHGVVGLTRSWATELAEFDINVSAIAPATIRPGDGHGSGMVRRLSAAVAMDPDEAFEVFSAQGNRPGPKSRAAMQDITDAVLFVASENTRMITGHVLHVDCGQATR